MHTLKLIATMLPAMGRRGVKHFSPALSNLIVELRQQPTFDDLRAGIIHRLAQQEGFAVQAARELCATALRKRDPEMVGWYGMLAHLPEPDLARLFNRARGLEF